MKQLKAIFTIVATLIGAGFASGQEINSFFYLYGVKGFIGLILCSILFSAIIFVVLDLVKKHNINTYKDFIFLLTHKRSFYINTTVNLFLLITFFIMFAGFGAFFSQEFGISKIIGSLLFAIICFFTLITNVNGVIKINSYLVPILIILIIIISFFNIYSITNYNFLNLKKLQTNTSNWFISCLKYCSYNSILLIPILITLKNNIKYKKDIYIISFLSCFIIFILSTSIFLLLTNINPIFLSSLEMPVIYVIQNNYQFFFKIYSLVILSSIYTTAISVGISFLQNISINKKNYPQIVLIMCISGLIISKINFSILVNTLYSLFGYLGLIQIFLLFKKSRTF